MIAATEKVFPLFHAMEFFFILLHSNGLKKIRDNLSQIFRDKGASGFGLAKRAPSEQYVPAITMKRPHDTIVAFRRPLA